MKRPGAGRASVAGAVGELAKRDQVLADLVERHGQARLGRRVPAGTRFAVLSRSICYQQLAGQAAKAIHDRFVLALGGEVTPERVLATPVDVLTGAGLSRAKVMAVTDLAAKVAGGQVSLGRIGGMADDEVVDHLVQVRGIGVWTAEMFLLSSLGRLDVWPVGDFGVRGGYAVAWGLDEPPSPKELAVLGERFRPYRSVVAWYCWKAADERKTAPTPLATDPSGTERQARPVRAIRSRKPA